MGTYAFINPYNFIPLTNEKKDAPKAEGALLSGVIQYSVQTRTPLFIPNTSCDHALTGRGETAEADHRSFEFFAYEDLSGLEAPRKAPVCRPVIPGSEIRGMFRSYYEILTESCLSGLDQEAVLSKRTNQNFKPGLLYRREDGTFDLYGAKDVLWRTKGENDPETEENWKGEYYTRRCYVQEDFPEGCRVYYKEKKRDLGKPLAFFVSAERTSVSTREGYVIKGEKGPEQKAKDDPNVGRPPAQKHCAHIFTLVQGREAVESGISLEPLEKVLIEFERNKVSLYTEYRTQLKLFREGRGEAYFPVYYDMAEEETGWGEIQHGALMLSPACITREIYSNHLGKLAGTFASCNKKETLCQACSLFGTVGKKFAVASRIRFSDLECVTERPTEALYDAPVTLMPLSGPKLNNMEFYVRRPNENAWFWTYDYYVDKNGRLHLFTPQLAGRKFYWHQRKANLPRGVKKTGQNMTIRPVSGGIQFSGSLYFDQITEKELQQLIWLLESGDEKETVPEKKRYGYKLGAAKPLGLGSIVSSVDQVLIRKFKMENGRIAYDVSPYVRAEEYELFDQKVIEDFHRMTDFAAIPEGETVSYPGLQGKDPAKEELKGYEWFAEQNHRAYDHKKGKPINMPKSRLEMYFAEYMEPLTPGLLSTMTGKPAVGRSGHSGDRSGHSGGQGRYPRAQENGGTVFVPGQKYEAKVKGVAPNGKALNIQVNGERGNVYMTDLGGRKLDSFRPGERISVAFMRDFTFKDGKIRKDFKVVR